MSTSFKINSVKRSFPRGHFENKISFICDGVSEVTNSFDINEGGLSFNSTHFFNLGSRIVMSFFIPEGGFFTLRGEIKNQKSISETDYNYGLAFITEDESLKQQLRAFIARSELNNRISKIS